MSKRRSAMRPWRLVLVVAALLALVAAGCGGGGDGDGGEGAAEGGDGDGGSEGGVIKMHANFELSGPGALLGTSKAIAAKVAAEMINEDGGIQVGDESYQLEVIECDNRTEPTYGVQCAQEAVDEGVLWTAAPDLGFEAAYEIYKENDIITVGNGGAASELLTPENIDQNPLLTFEFLTYQQSVESDLIQLRTLFPEVERIATLLPNDANGQVWAQATADLAPEYGFEVVAQELHPTDATGDFSNYLTTLKAANPDIIQTGYYTHVTAAVAEQARELEAAPMVGGDGTTFGDLEGVDFEGITLLAYQFGWNWFPGFMPEEADWQEAIERIDELADGEPYLPSIAVNGFIGDVMMMREAIEAAGTIEDPEAIVAEYNGLRYEGPFGPSEGLENRATDMARTPFVVNETGEVTAYVFPTGLSEDFTDEVRVPEADR